MTKANPIGNVPYTLDEIDKLFDVKEERSKYDSFVRTEKEELIYIHLDPAKNLILPKDKYNKIQICIPNSSGTLARAKILELYDDIFPVFTYRNFSKYLYQGNYRLVNIVIDQELNEAIEGKFGPKTPKGKELYKVLFIERVKIETE